MKRKIDLGKVVSNNIRSIREALGITQIDLALKAKMKPQALYRIESEGSNLTLKTLEQISSALSLEPFELLLGPTSDLRSGRVKLLEKLDSVQKTLIEIKGQI